MFVNIITIDEFEQLKKEIEKLHIILSAYPSSDGARWLTSHEVCERLKISDRTLQTYRDTGKIKFTKVGKVIRYKQSDVDDFSGEVS